MMLPAYSPSTWGTEVRQEDCKLEANLDYIVNSKPAYIENSCLKIRSNEKSGSVANSSFTEAELRKAEYQQQMINTTDWGTRNWSEGYSSGLPEIASLQQNKLEPGKIKSKVYFFLTAQPILP